MRDIYWTYTYLILSNAYTDSTMYNNSIVIIYALNMGAASEKIETSNC